jgi:hypothetical protein
LSNSLVICFMMKKLLNTHHESNPFQGKIVVYAQGL